MASEDLEQKYPGGKGRKFGAFEVFESQTTTLNQFAQHGILPNIDYGPYKTQKCDALVISRNPTLRAMVIGEHKAPGVITPKNADVLAHDLLTTKCLPTGALLGYLTDGITCVWINGRAPAVVHVVREDERPMPLKVNYGDKSFAAELSTCLQNFDPATSLVKAENSSNPNLLAQSVWQTIWRLKADRPEDCLATFVELFLFKFLNDLKLLTTDVGGVDVSFEKVIGMDREKCYRYYEEHVRPHVKSLFPAGKDGYSVINGIVLQGANRDHNIIFHELLKKFERFGSLAKTDPEFKTRLYESFLKESRTTGNFGQHFTPRKVVAAIHQMARIEDLPAGRNICDPASGVGGFVLEQMAHKLRDQWTLSGNKMRPLHNWSALEIVPKTAILAKANALVHCGELLADHPGRVASFSKWLNAVFVCQDKTALGSLEGMASGKYDLIITNPPFVVSGSADIGKIIKSNNKRAKYFGQRYSGVEGLFIQFIVQSLKQNGDAWVLLPETFFLRTTDQSLRDWLLQQCSIHLLAILPEQTFFNTPKRVVIVHMKRRKAALAPSALAKQLAAEKVLLFAIGEIGETRDVKRFPTDTDLPLLVDTYLKHQAGAAPDASIHRATVVKASQLYGGTSLNLRQFWAKEVAREIGLLDAVASPAHARKDLEEKMLNIRKLADTWLDGAGKRKAPAEPTDWKSVSLGDGTLFELQIGSRVLKKDIYNKRQGFPLYSANIRKPFGFVDVANAGSLEHGGCLWSIDGDFDCRGVSPGEKYSITDHCGQLKIRNGNINPEYLARQIRSVGADAGFNRDFRPSLKVMESVTVELPIKEGGDFDLALMEEWTAYLEDIEKASDELQKLSGYQS